MRRYVLGTLLAAGLGLTAIWSWAGAADGELPRRPRSLTERLEALRQDLLGEPAADEPRSRKSATKSPAARRPAATEAAVENAQPASAPRGTTWSRLTADDTHPETIENPMARRAAAPAGLVPQDARPAQSPQDADEAESNDDADEEQPEPAAPPVQSKPAREHQPATKGTASSPQSPAKTNRPAPAAANKAPAAPQTVQAKSKTATNAGKEPTLQQRLAAARTAAREPRPEAAPVERPAEKPGDQLAANRTAATNDVFRGALAAADRAAARPQAPKETADHSAVKAAQHTSDETVLITGQSPLLSVEATGPRRVRVGREAVFAVKVSNAGEAAANNVVVSIKIPPFAEVAQAQPTAGSTRAPADADAEPFEWKLDRLAAHAQQSLELRLVPHQSIPIELAMQWSCSPEASQTLVEVQEPKLLMVLSGPGEVLYGQSKIYKLTLSNPGNGDAENVTVGLMPLSRGGEPAATHRLGTIRAGESRAVEVELTARQTGQLTIKAQATADGGLKAEVAEPVLVRRANLQVSIEGPKVKYAGTPCLYRVHVTNVGNAVAEKVELSANLPADAKYVSSTGGGRVEADQTKVTWSIGALAPGAAKDFELQSTLLAAGDNRLCVTATADAELTATDCAATRVEALADLKLDLRDRQGPVEVGENTVYEIVVRNRGTKAAENVDLAVFFSEGLEPVDANGGPHDVAPGQVVFRPLRSLAAGAEAVFHVRAKADRPGSHIFRAELVCPSLETKIVAEETTRFYGGDAVGSSPALLPRAATRQRRVEREPRLIEPHAEEAADDAPAPLDEPDGQQY